MSVSDTNFTTDKMFEERYHAAAPAVICIICNERGEVLMNLRKNKFDAGKHSIPGGVLEARDKLLINTAVREIAEETGLIFRPDQLKIIGALNRMLPGYHAIEFVAIAKFEDAAGQLENREPAKSEYLKFFDMNNLPENTSGYARLAIENYLNGVFFSDIDY
jgi:ADP-ribose pyrophosphatase YjhB (NUDIX family)